MRARTVLLTAAAGAVVGWARRWYTDYHDAAWAVYRESATTCKPWCKCQCSMIGCGCHEGPPPRNDPRRDGV